MLEELKEKLYELYMELPRNNLVAWTSGNVSILDRESGLVEIRPEDVAKLHHRYKNVHGQ
jgi:L-ribulose-5-phosphate 4-epimerase